METDKDVQKLDEIIGQLNEIVNGDKPQVKLPGDTLPGKFTPIPLGESPVFTGEKQPPKETT